MSTRAPTILVSLLLMVGLFALLWQQIDTNALIARVTSLSPLALATAIVLVWLNLAVSTARYRLILQGMGERRLGFGGLFLLNLFGLFGAHIAPFGPANDIARFGYARLILKLETRLAVLSVIYDRLLALSGILAMGVALLPVQLLFGATRLMVLSQAALWLGITAAGIAAYLLAGRLVRHGWPRLVQLSLYVRGYFDLLGSTRFLVLQAMLAVAYCGSFALLLWVLSRGLGLESSFLFFLAFSPLVFLIQNLPIFYVGWGGREAAMVATLGTTGVLAPDQILAISISVGAIFLLAALPGGVLWLLQVRGLDSRARSRRV